MYLSDDREFDGAPGVGAPVHEPGEEVRGHDAPEGGRQNDAQFLEFEMLDE